MSEAAFKLFEETFRDQQSRYQARRIRSQVEEARKSVASAGLRWPFELLQNALDFGPRAGSKSVAIRLSSEQAKVSFEHDGVPFTSSDLTALLSGGSNKHFESEQTTGRFGTGFLVTHVLAERTTLRGLLDTPDGSERFGLLLDRGGDEDAILENMAACREAIRSASRVSNLDGVPSATFDYHIHDDNPLTLGVESLRSALPYLYATRPVLGCAELRNRKDDGEVWTPTEVTAQALEDGYVEERSIQILQNGTHRPEIRVFRFKSSEHGPASALVLTEHTEKGWRVVPPNGNAPRVYREYPLSGSGFIPTNFILDGKFKPDQDRSRLLLDDGDKSLVEDALSAAVVAVKHAFDQEWIDAHLLAQAYAPTRGFDTASAAERDWWHEQLASFAGRVAKLPIVDCSSSMLPAIAEDGAFADFIAPRLLTESSDDETTVDRMWPLLEAASELFPPRKELALAWSDIANGWDSLGLSLNRISVKEIPDWVKGESGKLEDLMVDGDVKQWMAHFLDVTGECWRKRSGVDPTVLHGMLPDQNQRLRSPSDLNRDNGIPVSLKNICADIGLDIRSQLLLAGFDETVAEHGLPHLHYALENALPNIMSEDDVIQKAVESLANSLPEDERCEDKPPEIQQGTVRLLSYLWESSQSQARSTASQIPLITHGKTAVRWSRARMMMAPIRCWHKAAQPFASAYPPDRVLDEMYSGSPAKDLPDCVSALIAWGIAIADPICADIPSALTPRRLEELSSIDTNGLTVPSNNEVFSQIALLQPEVLNRCREGFNEARALLGLVLCHVAPHDSAWQREQIVRGRRAGEPTDVPVAGALWLADLRIRPWVPIPDEDGKPMPMLANAKTLDELLDPGWLEHNDAAIRLLSDWFEFDRLELRLLGIEPDTERREELRNGLARLVESGGADLELYSSLAEEVEARKCQERDIHRFRCMGVGVQEAIKSAMEAYSLNLELVDHGVDYKVTSPTDNVLDDASQRFSVGPYLLEVKATTTGQARLTPLQAETASKEPDNYVLCVVDLRSFKIEDLTSEWSASIVEPLAKIVPDIGSRVEGTYSLVEAARTRSIAVRNESALRYEVPGEVWESGVSIGEWVSRIR
ncbi:MAG: ATP-binding protein [Chloroflexi bacterium]|nr:ATP-binding protein [Chloroflexota bacterium]